MACTLTLARRLLLLLLLLLLLAAAVVGSGTIDANELKATLEALGQNPTAEEIFLMISEVSTQQHATAARRATPRHATPRLLSSNAPP